MATAIPQTSMHSRRCLTRLPSNKLYAAETYALIRNFADGTIRRQTDSRSVKPRTGQLADSEFLQITESLHHICTLNITLNANAAEYRQCSNHVVYPKSRLERFILQILNKTFRPLDLSASWFVGELPRYRKF